MGRGYDSETKDMDMSKKRHTQAEADLQEQAPDENEKNPRMKEVISYVRLIIIACAAGLLANRFILINAVIPSDSMQNLLMVKDRIFGCRLSYIFNGPERYDVVMFKYPVDEKTIYIKRVIGLPGETVEIRDGKIYIDGSDTPIEENYLPEEWVVSNDGLVYEVPQDCYFMLGDNRNISEDSRFWAGIALEEGVADNEEDARSYTFVHEDKIIGRAIMKYYPRIEMFLNI